MKLAARNQLMHRFSLIDSIREFRKMGYDGMELSIVRGMTDSLALDYLDGYVIDEVNKVCREGERPFEISALSCHRNFVTDDFAMASLKKLINAAPKYGTDVVITATFIPFAVRENTEGLFEKMAERTKELTCAAMDNGVNIAIEIEPENICSNVDTFLRLAKEVNSPALKLNCDIGHFFLCEPDIYIAIERCAKYIAHVHVENMRRGEHCHKLPWEGEMDLVAVFKKLNEAGFNGFASLDIYIEDYYTAALKCADYIKKEVFSRL